MAEFAGGKIDLVAVRAVEGGPIVRHPLRDLEKMLPTIDVKVAAIYRNDQAARARAGDRRAGGRRGLLRRRLGQHPRGDGRTCARWTGPCARVIIAGGGNIGLRLARALEGTLNVKVIESSKRRCEYLAGQLCSTRWCSTAT